jgi:hypothetical protein
MLAVVTVAATAIWYLLKDDANGGGGTTMPGSEFPLALDVLGPGSGPQAGVTGGFDLGRETVLADVSMGADGGVITGTDGLTISVPAGAHQADTAYHVTSRPVSAHTLPDPLQPVSALYHIDNGGGIAEHAIEVDIPISIPDGEFAMGFFYDPATGEFEGMPIVGIDGDSVTVATRHFSEIVVLWYMGMPLGSLPAPTIDTGFRPGVDDWQFPNYGSAAAVNGHCSGQSLSALWYYTEQRSIGQPALFGRFDNTDADPFNPVWPATAGLWEDDRDGIRLASRVQVAQYAVDTATGYESGADAVAVHLHFSGTDAAIYSAFGLAMWVTGEPQYAGIMEYVDADGDRRWDGGEVVSGHAMIVYGAVDLGLYVADPNYPGDFRMIPWDPAKKVDPAAATPGLLGPYDSATKIGESGTTFNVIGYYAKSALVNWRDLAGAWPDFVAGTVGDDILPSFTLVAEYEDANGNRQRRPFRDRLVVGLEKAELTIEMADSGDCRPYQAAPNNHLLVPGPVQPCSIAATFYDGDAEIGSVACFRTNPTDAWTCSAPQPVTLTEGDNLFGVLVDVHRVPNGGTAARFEFVDFDRFLITRGSGLALEMVPNESESAGLELLVKDAPVLVENPDVPGEIIAITASYKAGPAVLDSEGYREYFPDRSYVPYVAGWGVLGPSADDGCMGSGWGGADAGFGPNLCIDVRLSVWDGDPSPLDPALVRREALDVNPTLDPCRVENYLTWWPCVESFTGNTDQGVEIFGWREEDRNVGVSEYRVRAVVEGIRIDVGTAYRNYAAHDVRTDRMREIVTALINEIARKIRVVTTG